MIGGGRSLSVFYLAYRKATFEMFRVYVAKKSAKMGFVKSWKTLSSY